MRTCLVIPGLFGSRLVTPSGAAVWPPRPSEFLRGALRRRRAERLLDPRLEVGGVLDWFACRDVYDGLLSLARHAGYREDEGSARRLIAFAYDWRRDLFETARALAAEIDRLDRRGERWLLLAHSMGGLVARLMLEAGGPTPWRDRIEALVAFGTPHAGAPATLARLTGALGGTGLSGAQTAELAADPRYPGPAQLLPPPGSASVIGPGGLAIDAYAAPLGLPAHGLEAARRLHEALDPHKRPETARYLFVAGAGEDTILRCRRGRAGLSPVREPGGDGAVPLWSAARPEVESWVVEAAHGDLFRDRRLAAKLAPILGAPGPRGRAPLVARLSIPDEPVTAGSLFVVRVNFSRPVRRFSDHLVLTPVSRRPAKPARRALSYDGPPALRIDLAVDAPGRAGFYSALLESRRIAPGATRVLAVAPRV